MYASHADAAIFSYYSYNLHVKYEELLKKYGLEKSVIGYRSGLGSNADMAADSFAEICCRRNCVAICIDIKDFFPSIQHKNLKSRISEVLSESALPKDWYAVFCAMTKYAYVEIDDIVRHFGIDVKSMPSPLVNDISTSMKSIRNGGLLRVNRNPCGIPQGSPISANFANVSMLQFDREINDWCIRTGSYYRRYSDDILIVCDEGLKDIALRICENRASSPELLLKISSEKTEISTFSASLGGVISCDRPLTYLGFTFDGSAISIKLATLSRYYRRMSYAARGTIRGAAKAGASPSQAYKREIISKFSHLGRRNFISYSRRSHETMKRVSDSFIRHQIRRHFTILLRKLERNGR